MIERRKRWDPEREVRTEFEKEKFDVSDVVGIEPIEYVKARRDKLGDGRDSLHSPRIIRYRNLTFNNKLTKQQLVKISREIVSSWRITIDYVFERYLVYKYMAKPLVVLDLVERRICTTKQMIVKYGESHCQQQASILLRILLKNGQASFKRVTVTSNPYRLGYTKEDREITFKAINIILGDHEKVKKQL